MRFFFTTPLFLAFILSLALSVASQGYKCGPDSPCPNSACCGASGWCGFGPTYCGDGCQSNCDATAECGEYAKTPGAGCPLNVCCSQFGFCGTTSEFCGDGCQSHCTQPKPSVAESNVQKRIVGYWEAWNMQHPCGTMGPGEIPVNLLTHLNIAFGYINQDYQLTNMDGLTPDVYKVVGDLKARNPNLKIMIALGGWAFSDPGTWQSVFPTLVSSESNRATFIKNLLGFLSQYGYDGVDFDWEYPGADDRGGSASDGVNYTQLLKELRAAIHASGKNYTVTFTAPTSYWYLRHFDLKAMTTYVDWVNLMAYDLHGVWDGNNPIGNQVLAHTNLTDIDLALDLFWRVNVEPSAVVLGLGFYGRSFRLTDTSCWKPGCKFNGPGKAGRCTGTPGILSYREIKEIQENTGGGSYLDKKAAVRYLVYSNNNWISFDDESTFRTKIEYANRMGLSGLMVWAIDLDDNYLDALRAVSNSSLLDNGRSNFDLVDLNYLFPPDQMPPAGTVPTYGLTTFGGSANSGEMDPSESGFGFLLFAGDSFAVSRLRKREGEPDPFVFIDCPVDVDTAHKDKTLTARVICLTDDLVGCFRVMERGVEGTIVEMPDNCAPNRFARAISLEESSDQDVPSHIRKRDPSSQVFDFKFDFDLKKMRRDTNNTSVRMDYSNVAGYWKRMVDSPGVQGQSKPSRDLVDRFWADQAITWRDRYERYYGPDFSYFPDDALKIKENISAPIFWHSVDQCPLDEADSSEEGFGAFVTGTVDAQFYFGMSLVARVTGFDSFDVTEANGFITIDGTADLTYGIGGAGVIDITKANKGNPAISHSDSRKLKGTAIDAGYDGSVTFDPYFEVTYQMATFNGTEEVNDYFDAAAPFDGLLSTRVLSDLGNMTAYFPFPNHDQIAGDVERRDSNKISTGTNNVLYSSTGDGGKIALGTFFRFGMNMEFLLAGDMLRFTSELADVQLVYDNLIEFSFYPGDKKTNIYQNIRKGKAIGWGDDEMVQPTTDRQSPDSGQVCYPAEKGNTNNKRDLSSEAGEEASFTNTMTAPLSPSDDSIGNKSLVVRQSGLDQSIDPGMIFGMSAPTWMMESEIAKFTCSDCLDCKPGGKYGSGSDSDPDSCCGCACMDCIWGYDDIPNCVSCQNDLDPGQWPWGHDSRRKRGISEPGDSVPEEAEDLHQSQARVFGKATTSFKKVTVCGEVDWAAGQGSYPAFPKDSRYPWDGIEGGRWDSISKYWGNSSADCASWQVTDLKPADEVDLPGGSRARAVYQTEHVFEGQLIGDFFSMWLHRGHIKNQDPMPPNPRPKMDCAITHNYVMDVDQNWVIDGEATTFLQLLLHELGSKGHLDRLTVMMGRPNGMKGSMFTGNEPISLTKYRTMSADEQLQAVKQMGMVFNYLNTPEVWDKFCATYEAIYDLLGDFNTWYATNGGTVQIPNLQDEWRNYIRTVLDSMASRTRTTFDNLYNNRWMTSNDKFVIAWTINRFINRQQIRLSGTCPHLGH